MKWITAIFLFLLIGCNVLKNKKDITTTKVTRTETFKKADTLRYNVPKAVYKDTTIYVRNFEKQGSNTLRIVYDKQGRQTEIDCMSDAVRELNETIESLKDNSKTKETDFKAVTVLYIMIGLIGIVCVIIFALFMYIRKFKP